MVVRECIIIILLLLYIIRTNKYYYSQFTLSRVYSLVCIQSVCRIFNDSHPLNIHNTPHPYIVRVNHGLCFEG